MLRAVKEGIQAVAPGLSLGKMWEDIKAEAKNQLAHGSHEIASALFSGTGSAFVMYPRASREAQKQEAQDKARDGREMQHER